MSLKCEICGLCDERSMLQQVISTGKRTYWVRQCRQCKLVYCSDCGVFAKGTRKTVFGLAAFGGRSVADKVECPKCNQDGWRGDGRMPGFDADGAFVGWRRA